MINANTLAKYFFLKNFTVIPVKAVHHERKLRRQNMDNFKEIYHPEFGF